MQGVWPPLALVGPHGHLADAGLVLGSGMQPMQGQEDNPMTTLADLKAQHPNRCWECAHD